MKSNTEVKVKFTVLHSKSESNALLSDCERIEREIEQTFQIDIPPEVTGLINNLHWSKTLYLIVDVSGHTAIDLKDAELRDDTMVNRHSEVGHETSVHKKEPFWRKLLSWL